MAKSSRIRLMFIIASSFILIIGCKSGQSQEILTQTSITGTVHPSLTKTSWQTEIPTSTHILELSPTQTLTPTDIPPTPTPNLYQFNGYWLSPIEEGTGAYMQTYGNVCPEFFDGSDLSCIENWMGEKGNWPEDYFDILVCPTHVVEWDIAWDHWGEKVFAVQGGHVQSVELESYSSYGVHFFIVDQQGYGANYGHVDGRSLVEQGIITQEQFEQVQAGKTVNGAMVYEDQKLGVTGDDCCPQGVLHIGPVYRFWGTDANGEFYFTEPSELWKLGEWPDVADSRPVQAGNPCLNPYNTEIDDFWNSGD